MANETPKPRARFTHAPEPHRPLIVRADASERRRSGLIPLCIGASRMMRGRDGVRRQYTARELRVEADRAQRDGREISVGVVCFECGRVYTTEEEFKADHTLTTEDYAKNAESHTWAYWCEDKYDPNTTETLGTITAEIKAFEAALKDANSKIAQCIDGDTIMKERERAEKVKGMLADARARKKTEDENIIGLLSETPASASRAA